MLSITPLGIILGPRCSSMRKSRFFNKEHLHRTQHFYPQVWQQDDRAGSLCADRANVRAFRCRHRRYEVYRNSFSTTCWEAWCGLPASCWPATAWAVRHSVKGSFHVIIAAILVISVMPMVIEYYLAPAPRPPPPAQSRTSRSCCLGCAVTKLSTSDGTAMSQSALIPALQTTLAELKTKGL